jgi:hypothetical protein
MNKMPNKDGTGPMGMGPRTGRGAGVCAGNEIQGYAEHVPPGWGRGRSRRRRFRGGGAPGWEWHGYDRPSREQEVDVLKAQTRDLHEVLQQINDRLDELEKK